MPEPEFLKIMLCLEITGEKIEEKRMFNPYICNVFGFLAFTSFCWPVGWTMKGFETTPARKVQVSITQIYTQVLQ